VKVLVGGFADVGGIDAKFLLVVVHDTPPA